MALWITNSFLRTKSFQIQSILPPIPSLPTTTTAIRTLFNVKPFNSQQQQQPPQNTVSTTTPQLTKTATPECLKHGEKSKPARFGKKVSGWFRGVTNTVKKAYLWNPNLDPDLLQSLISLPPIVLTGEVRRLEKRLGEAAMGNAFLLQGGDCDEISKDFKANKIPETFRVILQMSAVFMYGGQMPVIKVGNQFAKPRSDAFGNLNGDALALKSISTTPGPQDLIKAYHQSASTLNHLRAFATGGDTVMQRVTQWDLDFIENSEHGDRYRELASKVDEALGFMSAACSTVDRPTMTATEFWTSQECWHLPYEKSLTRKDSTSGLKYDCSAHFLWVGDQTCQLDGAHVKFLSQIANPLGIKVNDKMDPNELVKLIGILNPEKKPGRITIVTRMGAENIKLKLPNIVREVKRKGQIVTWVTDPDPMPRNKIKAPSSSLKTHPFDAIQTWIFDLQGFGIYE